MTLDGDTINLGDSIFILRAWAFGQVVYVGDSVATVRVPRQSGHRDFTVTGNGEISGSRGATWHQPLAVTFRKGDGNRRTKMQNILTAVAQEF